MADTFTSNGIESIIATIAQEQIIKNTTPIDSKILILQDAVVIEATELSELSF
jgi:hypothetical protein